MYQSVNSGGTNGIRTVTMCLLGKTLLGPQSSES